MVSSSLRKYVCMCSMSEVPPIGDKASGILLLFEVFGYRKF